MLLRILRPIFRISIGISVLIVLSILYSHVASAGCYIGGNTLELDCNPCTNFGPYPCDEGFDVCSYGRASCIGGRCSIDWYYCTCDVCSSGGGCFTGGTEVNTENSKTPKLQIKDLKPGDVVESFNPETGEIKEGTVSDITKTTREGYYILETESGEKVKVTGEHPFLAVKAKNFQFPIANFQLVDKLKNIVSNTLTYKVITGLQEKVVEILH